eukprot:jgi/Bigna1/87563/estExt_fgenesh1_pg.C_210203
MIEWLKDRYLPADIDKLILERCGVNQFFQLFDIDSNNSIDFSEFLILEFVMRYGPDHYRLHQIFNLFDLEGNGRITKKSFLKVTSSLLKAEEGTSSQGEPGTLILNLLMRMHTSMCFLHASLDAGSQVLSFDEWRRYAQTSSAVTELLEIINHRGGGGGDGGGGEMVPSLLKTPQLPEEGFSKGTKSSISSASLEKKQAEQALLQRRFIRPCQRFGPFAFVPSRRSRRISISYSNSSNSSSREAIAAEKTRNKSSATVLKRTPSSEK